LTWSTAAHHAQKRAHSNAEIPLHVLNICLLSRGQITVVMKFGGSSLVSAERMREVADIVCSFPEQYPCVVLSAMGKVGRPCMPPFMTLIEFHLSFSDIVRMSCPLRPLHRLAGPATAHSSGK
jgi:hypothetical protein